MGRFSPNLLMPGFQSGAGGGPPPFDPVALAPFALYDPSDMSTLFQDSGGTTPVTASGQPVGKMLDKSGNGYHLTPPTSASRPTYTESGALKYLAFDGVDDTMVNNSFPLGGTFDRITALSNADVADTFIGWWVGNSYEHMLTIATTTTHMETQTPSVQGINFGTLAQSALGVLVERHAGASSRGKLDNGAYTNGTLGTAALTGITLNRGGGGEQGQGNFFGSIMRAAAFSDAEIAQLVTWFGAKQGRSL